MSILAGLPPRARSYRGIYGPIPEKCDLERAAVNTLRRMMRDKKVGESCRIGAARTLLEYATADRDPAITLAEIAGDDRKLLALLRRMLPEVEARVAAQTKALTEGTSDDGRGRDPADR